MIIKRDSWHYKLMVRGNVVAPHTKQVGVISYVLFLAVLSLAFPLSWAIEALFKIVEKIKVSDRVNSILTLEIEDEDK